MSVILAPLNRVARFLDHWLMEPIDARVYAFVRIAYGLLCFSVIVETWPVSDSLFSGVGMSWHRPDLLFYLPIKYIRSPGAVKTFMVFAALASVMMMLGLFTRVAAIALFFWNFSYCAIGYPAEAGYDGIARIVGFLMVWAPAVRTWALDARIFGETPAEVPRYSLRMMQVQLTIIYIATVWLKAPDSYWRSGELMAYFMMSMYSRFPSWEWAAWGRLSVLLSWGTLVMETLIPFCLFSPRFRRLGFVMGLALHGGIAFSSTIFMFSLAMVPLYLAFFTREDVEVVIRVFEYVKRRLTRKTEAAAQVAVAAPKESAKSA